MGQRTITARAADAAGHGRGSSTGCSSGEGVLSHTSLFAGAINKGVGMGTPCIGKRSSGVMRIGTAREHRLRGDRISCHQLPPSRRLSWRNCWPTDALQGSQQSVPLLPPLLYTTRVWEMTASRSTALDMS
ncbi:hypothetical protein MRB53_039100 [Persea americana]|nr:hypothetical protein MRB53_039100 [Persea americana]